MSSFFAFLHHVAVFTGGWVPVLSGPRDRKFDEHPEESIAEWHRRLGLGWLMPEHVPAPA